MSFIASLGNWLRKISQSFAHATINGQNIILTKHNGDTIVLDVLSQAGFVAKSGDTLTGPLDFRNAQTDYTGNPVDQIRGVMGLSDRWRIAAGASANDAGYIEIATADNGNEPVYVSQYTGNQDSVFGTLKRRATLLDASGNTDFPGSVSASSFIGALTGNVTGDVTGNVSGSAGWLKTTNINYKNIDTDYSNTYVIGLSDNNHGTRPDGTWTNLISLDSYHFQSQLAVTNIVNGTHVPKFFMRSKYRTGSWSAWVHLADDIEATSSAKGLMSAADKSKLDSVSPIKYASIGNYQSIIEYENQFLMIFSSGTATNGGVITFPRPFSAIPVVLCQHPASTLAHMQAYAATTTGFTVAHSSGSAIAVRYIAVGKGV